MEKQFLGYFSTRIFPKCMVFFFILNTLTICSLTEKPAEQQLYAHTYLPVVSKLSRPFNLRAFSA